MVPLIVHTAAAGGVCWAPRATLAITTAIAAVLIAVVDLARVGMRSPKIRIPIMSLLP
jgi:hypothetical protein